MGERVFDANFADRVYTIFYNGNAYPTEHKSF